MKIKVALFILFTSCCFAKCNSQKNIIPASATKDSVYTYHKASADGIGKFYMGREISRVIGAGASEWLERSERSMEENTNLSIEKIILDPTAVVADIGAGTGYYSFKLSSKVPQGKVYAIEIQDEHIKYLKNKKTALKDSIVEIVKSSPLSINLPDNSVDLAIMVDVYHELEFPYQMLQALSRALKKSGKILLIEYRGEDPSVPIKALHKTTVIQLTKELSACGFQLNFKGDFLPIQHFLLYKKND